MSHRSITMSGMLACPRCRKAHPDDLTECPDDGAALLPSSMVPLEDAPIEPGTLIGEYRVDRKLGSGTFGDVYAGEQPLIGKRVAIKLLHRKFSGDAEVVSRFVAEARAVNRIRHENIIDIFSFGSQDGRHYFVMELCDGLTLGELLHRERRLSIDRALPIFQGIASGLDAAHEAGITHRDLKPDNVLLVTRKEGGFSVKLLDFGIAKLAGDDLPHRTATGMAMGTPRYMSPEQCRGKPVDSRADVYSLGVVIHEALTGRPLFDADSSMDVFFKHVSEAPPRMSSVRPDLPADLDEPVLAMLAKRPKQRPATAGEAVRALVEAARAHVHAATLPASSASRSASKQADPTTAKDASEAPKLGTDDPTIAVRQRKTPEAKPVAIAAPRPNEAQIETEIATAETIAVSSGASVRFSTEIAPASKTGTLLDEAPETPAGRPSNDEDNRSLSPSVKAHETLRSPGPLGAPAARERRGAGLWIGVGGVAIALIAAGFAITRSSGERATGASAAASASSAPEMVTVRVKVAPPDAWLVLGEQRTRAVDPLIVPRSTQGRLLRVEREGYETETVWVVPERDTELSPIALHHVAAASSATPSVTVSPAGSGKPIAKPKLHGDLERPPELDRPR